MCHFCSRVWLIAILAVVFPPKMPAVSKLGVLLASTSSLESSPFIVFAAVPLYSIGACCLFLYSNCLSRWTDTAP